MVKEVYNPENQRTDKTRKAENPKGEKAKTEKTEEKAAKSGEKRKAPKTSEMEGDYLEFDIKAGLNPYNFIHLPKKTIAFLPFKAGEKLHGHIDTENQTLVIWKA